MLVLIAQIVVERGKILNDFSRSISWVVDKSEAFIDFQFFLLSVIVITDPFSEWRNVIISGYSLRRNDRVTIATPSLDGTILGARMADLRLLDVF